MTQTIHLKNGLPLTLRLAVPDDAERILVHVRQIGGESDNLTFGEGEFTMTVEEERAYLEQEAANPNSLYLLAEVEGEIAGSLTFNTGKKPRLQHAGMFGISVKKKYWNQGVGHHLLTYLLTWARERPHIRKINLIVRADNQNAIHLYEKHGFQKEGLIRRELYIRGEFFDSYMMGQLLDPSEGENQ